MVLLAERHGTRCRFFRVTPKGRRFAAWPTQSYASTAIADLARFVFNRRGIVLTVDESRRVADDDAPWFTETPTKRPNMTAKTLIEELEAASWTEGAPDGGVDRLVHLADAIAIIKSHEARAEADLLREVAAAYLSRPAQRSMDEAVLAAINPASTTREDTDEA